MSYVLYWYHGDNVTETELTKSSDDQKAIIEPHLELAENEAGSFTFVMMPEHRCYGQIRLKSDCIGISLNGYDVFYGRIISYKKDFDRSIEYTCEGALAFLDDAYLYSSEVIGSGPFYPLARLFSHHLQAIRARDSFVPHDENGSFNVSVPDIHLYNKCFMQDLDGDGFTDYAGSTFESFGLEKNSFVNCYEAFQSILSHIGGYVETTRMDYGDHRVNGYRWFRDYWDECGQEVRIGENLLDYVEEYSVEDLLTCVKGVSSSSSDETDARPYYSYGNGELISKYGIILGTIDLGDETDETAAKTKCLNYLQNQYDNLVYTVTVADLSQSDDYENMEPIRMHQLVHVVSEPHRLDAWMPVTAMSMDLDDPSSTTITLGKTVRKGVVEKLKNYTKKTKKSGAQSSEKGTSGGGSKATQKYKALRALNMRASASSKSSKLTTVPKNAKFNVTKKSGKWLKTSYNSKTGWVYATYCKKI